MGDQGVCWPLADQLEGTREAHHFIGPKKNKFWSLQAWALRAGCPPSLKEHLQGPGATAGEVREQLDPWFTGQCFMQTRDTAVNVAAGPSPHRGRVL